MPITPQIARDIEDLLRKRYAQIPKEDNEKIIDGIQTFMTHISLRRSSRALLQEAAKTLHRIFPFQEIAIGIKSPEDGLYRYEAFIGYTHEAEETFRKLVYTLDEFFDQGEFPSIRISKLIDFAVAENEPAQEKEQECWNRPSLLKVPRKTPDEFLEGDYIDVLLYGEGNEMIGWLELSAPRDGRMPSGSVLKGIELFSSVLALAMQCEVKEKKLFSQRR